MATKRGVEEAGLESVQAAAKRVEVGAIEGYTPPSEVVYGEPHGAPPPADEGRKMTIRVLIGAKASGSLIGKGGSVINGLRGATGADIRLVDQVDGAANRILTVHGTATQTADALHGVADRMMKGIESFREYQRSQGKDIKDDSGLKCSISIILPNAVVGSVIGKGGSRIVETRAVTGTQVKVSDEFLANSSEKTVLITGAGPMVHAALRLITRQVMDACLTREQPFEESLAPAAQVHTPEGTAALAAKAYGYPPAPYGYPPSPYGAPPSPYGAPPAPYGAPPAAGRAPTSARAGSRVTKLPVPANQAGNIIGRGGSVIRGIRTQSGAEVRIADAEQGSFERVVTITGDQTQSDTAVALIYRALNTDRNGQYVGNYQPPSGSGAAAVAAAAPAPGTYVGTYGAYPAPASAPPTAGYEQQYAQYAQPAYAQQPAYAYPPPGAPGQEGAPPPGAPPPHAYAYPPQAQYPPPQ